MFCRKCGAQLKDGAKFCPSCGTPVQGKPVKEKKIPRQPKELKPEKAEALQASPKKRQTIILAAVLVGVVAICGAIGWKLVNSGTKPVRPANSIQVDHGHEEDEERSETNSENTEQVSEKIWEAETEEIYAIEAETENADAQETLLEEELGETDDFILSFSSYRRVTEADLEGLTPDQLRIARNEIYARHGRMFQDEFLVQWFNSKPWYREIEVKFSPEEFDANQSERMTELELDNAKFIREYEKE